MMYAPGVKEDEKLHKLMHCDNHSKEIGHKGWKNEKIVYNGGKEKVGSDVQWMISVMVPGCPS